MLLDATYRNRSQTDFYMIYLILPILTLKDRAPSGGGSYFAPLPLSRLLLQTDRDIQIMVVHVHFWRKIRFLVIAVRQLLSRLLATIR